MVNMGKNILEKVNTLASETHHKIYITGGYIRSLMLNHPTEGVDIDLVVTGGRASSFARKTAGALQGTLVVLDRKNGIYRVVIQQKKGIKDIVLDFTRPKGRNLNEDLERRDFTINSLAVELGDYLNTSSSWQDFIIDIHGGIADLKERKIRAVSKESFMDDPLRLIRGIRLCAVLDFRLEEKTLNWMFQSRYRLTGISGERIRDELWKILDVKESYPWIYFMEERLEFLSILFPEVKQMKATEQNHFHGEEVWSHCLRTFKSIEKNIESPPFSPEMALWIKEHLEQELAVSRKRKHILKFFALFHDVGKIKTKKVLESGRIVFHRHEVEGIPFLEKYSRQLKLSSRERRTLSNLTRQHMHPLFLQVAKKVSPRAFYKLFKKCGGETIEVLMHSLSDFIAKREAREKIEEIKPYQEFIQQTLQKYFYEKETFVSPPEIINGEEIMNHLNLRPSPGVGYILGKVKEAQAEGKVKNKREAINLASQVVQTSSYQKRFRKV